MSDVLRVLPPGVEEAAFDDALGELRRAVGDENVIDDPAGLEPYRDPYPMLADEQFLASAVVAPGSTEEVQEVVRIANRHGIPLSPISTGKNNGYGGPSPRLTGAIVVDMGTRMNRILEVNEKYGYALLEPGVTYFDLYEHLEATNSILMLDTPDLGLGQRGRQHAGPRRRLHALRRPLPVADGHGGGPPAGRGHAHGHGRAARHRTRGSCSPTASARTRTGCSPSPTWASSRRWASRSCSVRLRR